MTVPWPSCFAGMDTTRTTRLPATQFRPGPGSGVLTSGAITLARPRVFATTARRPITDGTVSVSGVYGGALDPMPMMQMFDKGIAMRMGQCHVKQWTGELRDVLVDADPFGVEQLATHRVGLDEAATMYDVFQKKQDGCQKVVLKP